MISQQSRHCTVELKALPSRIGQVRRIISAQLRHWQLEPLIDQATLGVTELLSNVHRHAGPDKQCTVEIVLLPELLTVSVHDHDPRLPQLHRADSLDTCGRGLALVEAVSASWGMRAEGPAGKVVWFTLPTPVPGATSLRDTAPRYATGRPHGAGRTVRLPEKTPARSAVVG
ncbi:ATP-binding protein [Streptomyces triticagri]|uniref:ATP-binding protein n=1 Tax=Streptomyces triticagri TaxID=2293568 RepID=A0A372M3N3_9ACTN|nr:ATP-binding protein [Streptomyces triticagri]RFU85073.1 ATP-binding protein [Streptomyces triticagri]